MFEEDDPEKSICCPYCGATSEDGCQHVLGMVDHTFNECYGGSASDRYYEFRRSIEDHFLQLIKARQQESFSWGDVNLQELWNLAVENHSPRDEEVSLEMFAFTRLFTDLLEFAGGKKYPGSLYDGYGPGMTSVISLFHAQDPQKVFEGARSELDVRLGKVKS